MTQNKIIIITGPSGVGKSTIVKKLLSIKDLNLSLIKSTVTRKKRPSDNPDQYNYITKDDFLKLSENDQIVESNFYNKNYYCTTKKDLEKIILTQKNAIKELDINNATKIKKMFPKNTIIIFINSDLEKIKNRIINRGENTDSQIQQRLKLAKKELDKKYLADHIITNFENLQEKSVQEISDIIHNL